MRDYIDRRVTPPKRVTSPTWGPLACVAGATWGGRGGGRKAPPSLFPSFPIPYPFRRGPPPPCKQALRVKTGQQQLSREEWRNLVEPQCATLYEEDEWLRLTLKVVLMPCQSQLTELNQFINYAFLQKRFKKLKKLIFYFWRAGATGIKVKRMKNCCPFVICNNIQSLKGPLSAN